MASKKMVFSKLLPVTAAVLIAASFLISCNNNNINKVDLTATGADGSQFEITGDIDKTNTSNCGTASPYSASSTTTTTTTTTTGGSSTNLFTINSRLYFTTGAFITLKFLYDSTQNQGSVDSQQGFSYSGLPLLNQSPVVANFGKIFWGGSGVPVDTGTSSTQALSYLTVTLNLVGNKVTSGSAGLALTQCYTTDFIHCTSATSSSMCYTQDGVNCYNTNTATGPSVTIKGDINCTSNSIPAGSSTTTSQ
ncbi:hypothetical protein EHQ53_13165 [Leptospira langatensis]|uniref:Lipoprotein n=1 Tax=Leptospira langatensis TaxID=2484983 RepID=A0A5F1ZTE9_9LEPT|nr:hypothetical protein [Leptospira langatensis]TGK02679.1 hypothetical protein EHO57_04945 [Leptospira langatensis]TGL40118.1 hypothetical protein EHQ53_13165 [Leptospira langatensis]